jgi:Uma2 family endonuclease
MVATIQRHAFTVEEFDRMRLTGILTEDDRVELIDGEVREMTPIGPIHSGAVMALVTRLVQRLGDAAAVNPQNPVILDDYTEPQPDVAVLRPPLDQYRERHARPDDVLWIVEVADTTLEYDRQEKLPRYARAGIREVWIVDCEHDAVEQYTQLEAGRYAGQRTLRRGEAIVPEAITSVTLTVDEILGPA